MPFSRADPTTSRADFAIIAIQAVATPVGETTNPFIQAGIQMGPLKGQEA